MQLMSSKSSSLDSHKSQVRNKTKTGNKSSSSDDRDPKIKTTPEEFPLQRLREFQKNQKVGMLFVTRLSGKEPIQTLQNQIRQLFQTKCTIESVIIKRSFTGIYSYAFVNIVEGQKIDQIIKSFNGTELGGVSIVVERRKSFDQKDSHPHRGYSSNCYRCGKPGHFARDCSYDDKRDHEKQKAKISKKQRAREPSEQSQQRQRHKENKHRTRTRDKKAASKKKKYQSSESSSEASSSSQSSSYSSSSSESSDRKRRHKRRNHKKIKDRKKRKERREKQRSRKKVQSSMSS